MLFGSLIGDFIAGLFFIAGIWLAWLVTRRKTASSVLGSISVVQLVLSLLYFLARFIQWVWTR